MKKLLCLLGGVLLIINAYSQNEQTLKVGDTIPNLLLVNIKNANWDTARLYDSNKAVIFDFFETHCGGCIELLPYLDKIQKKKKDLLSIYVISDESEKVIKHFIKTNPKGTKITIPFVTSDTLIKKLFKHRYIPHEVWVGNDHVVKAITSSDYINEANIEKLCKGQPLYLPVKNDSYNYDPSRPLSDYAMDDRVIQSSTLTGYIDNLTKFYHSSIIIEGGLYKKIFFTNYSLLAMIGVIYENKFTTNRFILNVRDSSRFLHFNKSGGDSWFVNNAYCYEVVVSNNAPAQAINDKIVEDLEHALCLNIQLVKRRMPCYLLIRNGQQKVDPKTKHGKKVVVLFPKSGEPVELQNVPLSYLVGALNAGRFGDGRAIVLDSTNLKSNVDIRLPISDIKNISNLRKALRPYGLDLIKSEKVMDMINICDN